MVLKGLSATIMVIYHVYNAPETIWNCGLVYSINRENLISHLATFLIFAERIW